jgi:hypothetical protein
MRALTTQQIIDAVDGKLDAGEDWEDIFLYLNMTGNEEDEKLLMKAAARFLESHRPGARWTSENFHQLMDLEAGGIWDSAEELGRLRAHDDLEDGVITVAEYDKIRAENGWEAYCQRKPGYYIFPVEGKPGAIISIVDLESFDQLSPDGED